MSDSTSEGSSSFQQRLGLFDATMLVMGTMIGSGIFVTSVTIAKDVGTAPWLLVVWALAGIMTVIGALSYGELAGMMPNAGGQYVYLREAYSPLWGFLYGWTCFLVIQTGSIAAVAVVFAQYLGVLVPFCGTENIRFKVEDVNWSIYLYGLKDPIWKMKDFKVSAGQIVAVAVIVFLTALNCRGVREGKWVQNFFTVAKTSALVLLIVVGLAVVASPEARTLNFQGDSWSGIEQTQQYDKVRSELAPAWLANSDSTWILALMVMGGAMVGALFSADAWNNITFTAGEIRNPRRNLPLSLALGTGSVIVLYLLANLAYIESLPVRGTPELEKLLEDLERRTGGLETDASKAEKEALLQQASTFDLGIVHARDQRIGTAVMELWSPRFGAPFMALAIMVSTFGCVNGMILMGARLYFVMSRDALFFRSVGALNGKGVPAAGLVLQAGWSSLLVFSGSYDDLLDFVIFAVLVFYVLTVAGLFVLRRTRPNAERPYRALGYPLLPALYVILCTAVMLDLLIVKPIYTWPGLLIVLSGIPVYFLWKLLGRRAPA